MSTPRAWLPILVGCMLGFGLGWWGSRPAAIAPDPVPVAGPVRTERPAERPPAPDDCPEGGAREIAALQSKLRFNEMLYDSLYEEHFGHPVPWPADTPEQYTASGYRGVIERALAECHTGMAVRGLECAEPPCIGAFAFTGEQQFFPAIGACPAWTEAFGDSLSTYSNQIDCGDGTQESMLLLSPYWEQLAASTDPEARANYAKRLEQRQQALTDAWTCGASAPPGK